MYFFRRSKKPFPNFLGKDVLAQEKEIGLVLPCNVIVYEENDRVFVSAILPTVVTRLSENAKIQEIAQRIEDKLKKAVDNV